MIRNIRHKSGKKGRKVKQKIRISVIKDYMSMSTANQQCHFFMANFLKQTQMIGF